MRTASMFHPIVVALHTGGEPELKGFGEAAAQAELGQFIWNGRVR